MHVQHRNYLHPLSLVIPSHKPYLHVGIQPKLEHASGTLQSGHRKATGACIASCRLFGSFHFNTRDFLRPRHLSHITCSHDELLAT